MKSCMSLAAALVAAVALAVAAAPPSPLPVPTLKGEVLEVQNVSTFTYLRVKTRDGELWASVPRSAVKKGDAVTLYNPTAIENFESKALKRKFDKLVFASLTEGSAKAPAAAASPHGAVPTPAKPVGKIAKASTPDAKTVAEVTTAPAALKDKTVTIRGQVVKYSAGIMGKNWAHLQDGSGSAAKGTHDILVTTKDAAAVGDVVSASGTVRTDVNLGSGYAYAVMVEDAKLRK